MKREELKPYLESLRDWLLNSGFTEYKHFILNSYTKAYGIDRELSISTDFGNQYIYVKDNKDDSVVSIYNSDINGNLSIEYLEQLVKTIYWNGKERS